MPNPNGGLYSPFFAIVVACITYLAAIWGANSATDIPDVSQYDCWHNDFVPLCETCIGPTISCKHFDSSCTSDQYCGCYQYVKTSMLGIRTCSAELFHVCPSGSWGRPYPVGSLGGASVQEWIRVNCRDVPDGVYSPKGYNYFEPDPTETGCVSGYYLNNRTCTRCPAHPIKQGGNTVFLTVTSAAGNTGDITSCYTPQNTIFRDDSGMGHFTGNCSHK